MIDLLNKAEQGRIWPHKVEQLPFYRNISHLFSVRTPINIILVTQLRILLKFQFTDILTWELKSCIQFCINNFIVPLNDDRPCQTLIDLSNKAEQAGQDRSFLLGGGTIKSVQST